MLCTNLFILKAIYKNQTIEKLNHQSLNYAKNNTGYTLIEVLVAVLIVGILSAIAAPSWLAFVNIQRVNKANDAILAALQEAQREAKKNKRNYSVSFTTDSTTQVAKIAVYPTSATGAPNNYWRVLGEDLGLKQKEVVLGTNITNQNTAGTSVTYASAFNASTPQTITFDYMGTLPSASFGTIPSGATEPPGFRIVVAVPQPGSSTQPSNTKRCVIVQTLIGGMRTNKDTNCNI
ncbi:type II secretion system protein [Fischerella sp. JS2]|uniref:type II secretion system protein n=1 Tax=Fischerella sp. JS2 TaxID=2597771 RepID=UPI0028E50EFD|nr:type II secretion system protein [Fischerella sp. JS2]